MMATQAERVQSPEQAAPPGFAYSIGRTVTDNRPQQRTAATWADFAAVFDCPDAERSQGKGGRYLCGPMSTGQPERKPYPATWRTEELAAPLAWLAFDFDRLTPQAAQTLVKWFGEYYRCLWYHTASSRQEAPRIRIVAALDREVTPEERRRICQAIGQHLGESYPRDPCQDRASQPLYLPLAGASVMRHDDRPPIPAAFWLAQPLAEQNAPPATTAAPSTTGAAHEIERAVSALQSLNAECRRDDWVRIGMAFKAAGGSFEDWHDWSATAGNYGGEADCRSTWNSMKGQGIGPGTLFAAAHTAGWHDPAREMTAREAFGLGEPPQRFRLATAAEVGRLPPVRWRVRGVLPEAGIAAVYGPPGCGKSFLVLDLLAAVAAGRLWFGCRVKPAPVLYIGLEGEAGIAQRVRAHQMRHGASDRMRFLLGQPLDLRKPADCADIISAARAAGLAGGVLVVDTLAASAPGMDENASADMGDIIAGLKALQAALSGLVLAIHHTGKDSAKGLRGHSSLLGALDAAIEVTRTEGRREWRTAKAKDGADGNAHPFRLEVVGLGADDEGEAITSCVCLPDSDPSETVKRAKVPTGGNQKIVWDALGELLQAEDKRTGGRKPDDAPKDVFGRSCLRLEDAITRCRDRLEIEDARKTERAKEAITGLVKRGLLECREGWIWRT